MSEQVKYELLCILSMHIYFCYFLLCGCFAANDMLKPHIGQITLGWPLLTCFISVLYSETHLQIRKMFITLRAKLRHSVL